MPFFSINPAPRGSVMVTIPPLGSVKSAVLVSASVDYVFLCIFYKYKYLSIFLCIFSRERQSPRMDMS